jgi:apolipoprotein N-acyltransferase
MAASVVLCLLCVHPCELWPAVLVAWTPFVVAVSNLGWRRAAWLGLLHGVLLNAAAFHWIYPPLRGVAELSAPTSSALFLALVLVQGARSAVVAGLAAAGMRRGWPAMVVFPLALVTGELVCPAVFPWHTALFTTTTPAWMQLAEVGGPLILSAWVGAVNAGFAQAWLERGRGARDVLKAASPALAVLSLVTVAGHWRITTVEARASRADAARIGVIQGDLGPLRHERRDPVKVYRERSLQLLATEPKLDLLVWPETAVSYPTRSDRLAQFFSDVALRNRRDGAGARKIDVPLLTGMVVARDTEKVSRRLSNSAVLADPSGRVLGEYDKQHLVPLGERSLSDWFPRLSRLFPPASEFVVGDAQGSLPFAGHRLGVSICYEDILHRKILSSVRDGQPDLLLNLTSDSWFEGSPGPALHLALASLRAVEHRRYLLHASTGGVTAVVAPTGRIEWHLPEGPASGVASVRWLDSRTPYQQHGDTPWIAAAGLSVLFAALRRRRIGLPFRYRRALPADVS